jgi:hypothetical protein
MDGRRRKYTSRVHVQACVCACVHACDFCIWYSYVRQNILHTANNLIMLPIQTPVAKHQIKTISNSTMTYTDLQDRSLDSDHRRCQLAQNI